MMKHGTTTQMMIKLGAVAMTGLLTVACTDQQQQSAEDNWDQATDRTEELYNDIRSELRDARERGRICLSSYEEMQEEWQQHTDEMDTERADQSWREQMQVWGDELGDMFDDMGDHIDRNC